MCCIAVYFGIATVLSLFASAQLRLKMRFNASAPCSTPALALSI